MTIEEMRNELIKRIPEMKSETETASDAVIEIAYALSKLPKEQRDEFREELEKEEARREVVKMIDNTPIMIKTDAEREELTVAKDHIIKICKDTNLQIMLDAMYQYGKARGIREERQKKKARLINRQAMDLANSL